MMTNDPGSGFPMKKKTHRGRRSRGKGPMNTPPQSSMAPTADDPNATDHHAAAKASMVAAAESPTVDGSHKHLMAALSAMKKARASGTGS